MEGNLSLSLDDIIKRQQQQTRGNNRNKGHVSRAGGRSEGSNKTSNGRESFRVTVSNSGTTGASNNRSNNNSNRRIIRTQDADVVIPRGGQKNAPVSRFKSLTVLKIENLDYEVLEQDLSEVFAKVGPIARCRIDYDASGRSNGSAEISYKNLTDIQTAFDQYDSVVLDGKPMKLSIVTKKIPVRNNNNRGRRGAFGDGRGGRRGGSSNNNARKITTVEDLDAEMEDYMQQ